MNFCPEPGHNTGVAGDTGDEAADDNPDDAEFDLYDGALKHVSQDIFDMLTVSDEDDFEGFELNICFECLRQYLKQGIRARPAWWC